MLRRANLLFPTWLAATRTAVVSLQLPGVRRAEINATEMVELFLTFALLACYWKGVFLISPVFSCCALPSNEMMELTQTFLSLYTKIYRSFLYDSNSTNAHIAMLLNTHVSLLTATGFVPTPWTSIMMANCSDWSLISLTSWIRKVLRKQAVWQLC